MVRTTRAQREALQRRWNQATHDSVQFMLSYRQFRRTVQPTFGCDNAVTVKWCGIWLCIETDGYTHS